MVRNQLLNVFPPAHEAAGVALTNIFFHLARHPKSYSRLRRAIDDAEHLTPGTNIWTFKGLKGLKGVKYLQYVINEKFRLNPAIGTNARNALRDTVLPTDGDPPYGLGSSPILIRKGDTVSKSFYAIHRRRDLFAGHFRPERWEKIRSKPWKYQTFVGGPRHCLGQRLALKEVAFTTAKIVKKSQSIENRDQVMELVEDYKITTQSRNGAKVSLVAA